MRFIADAMIGKLTRWLRMLGHDVKYLRIIEDELIIKVANDEKRILLTKDKELYQKAIGISVEAYLVKGKTRSEILAGLARHFDFMLELNMDNSRCPKCNGEIQAVSKKEVVENLNASTYSYYDYFWICSICRQIYWKGHHWKRIKETLAHAAEYKNLAKCKISL